MSTTDSSSSSSSGSYSGSDSDTGSDTDSDSDSDTERIPATGIRNATESEDKAGGMWFKDKAIPSNSKLHSHALQKPPCPAGGCNLSLSQTVKLTMDSLIILRSRP